MRAISYILFLLKLSISASGQDVPNFSWSPYDTAQINVGTFSKLTAFETRLSREFTDFRNNHQRLRFLGKHHKPDLLEYDQTIIEQFSSPFISLPCKCVSKSDTVYITTAIGLFSGLGMMSAVTKNSFGVTLYNYLNEKKELRLEGKGTNFTDNITVPANQQKLTISNVPVFKQSEIITGMIEADFKEFYRYFPKTQKLVPQNFKVALLFRCRIKVAPDYR